MTLSNAYAAKRALVALLQSASELTDVQISYALKPRDMQRQRIWGGATRFSRVFEGLGGPRDETVTVELYIEVDAVGGDVEEADTLTEQLAEVVEAVLDADPRLGGSVPGLIYRAIDGGETEYSLDDDTAYSQMRLDVAFRAHLR